MARVAQDFIWEVSLALSKAYEAAEKKMADAVGAASTSGKEALDALKKMIVGIYHPEGAQGESPENITRSLWCGQCSHTTA